MSGLVNQAYTMCSKTKTSRTTCDFGTQDNCLQKRNDDRTFKHNDCSNCNGLHFQVLKFHKAHKHNPSDSSPQ